MTANKQPKCRETSKALLLGMSPNIFGTNMRCALDEIGKNSVKPCTIDNIMIISKAIWNSKITCK